MNIREKILIVEDEKSIAHFISTILNSNDYETLLARSGSEAKTMISSHCPDLVILDLGLPDMDGIAINLPAYLAGLPEEAYLSEFQVAPEVVEEESESSSDEIPVDGIPAEGIPSDI